MKRYEACELLTKIASDELINSGTSLELFKERDVVICGDNKILDVLATDKDRKRYMEMLDYNIRALLEIELLSFEIGHGLTELEKALKDGFDGKCDSAFLTDRCSKCPNFKKNA